MVQKTIVSLTDDLDGTDADETMAFGLDGAAYEIDLSEKNATILREALAPYVEKARRAGGAARPARGAKPGRSRRRGGSGNGTSSAVREWARANGYTVNDRGRMAASVVKAYEAANA